MTDFPTKLVLPSKRLTEGCSYQPSWMYSPPKVRGFIPTLNGRFGLSKPKVPEGTAHANDHADQDGPICTAG
jgi:hypothetical protein